MSLNLSTDLRDGARTLRKQPRFLIVASLTLALGIGAVTSIFSVVNGVLFTPLPYPQADRLVNIWSTAPLKPMVVNVIKPSSTKPMWLTLE